MRIAFFGGSFDPPHLGHLRIALTACDRLQLDQVLLAPVGRQPLKSHEPAPFADRLRMVELLAASHPQLVASPADAPLNSHPNYTTDTLARLRPTLPPQAELFFLAGADSFLTLPDWHDPAALLQPSGAGGLLTGWILAARPGFALASLAGALPSGYTLSPSVETPGPVLTQRVRRREGTLESAAGLPLYLLPDLDDPSTATRIRGAFAQDAEAPHLLPGITQYIRDHGLYRVLG
jgi:nicotinate-nucleotide adenylyltransferase